MMPFRCKRLSALFCALALLAACTHTPPVQPAYEAETFSPQSPFQSRLGIGPLAACHLGQRALLSQGYLLETATTDTVKGYKFFQRDGNRQLRLEITLVCMPEGSGSVIYANALQTRYEIKATANSSGLTVAGIGSISLPWSEGKEALIKVGEETVSDPDFYRRLFELLRSFPDPRPPAPEVPDSSETAS